MARTPDITAYTGLITSQHQSRINYMATVSFLAQHSVDNQAMLDRMMTVNFDLDVAVGLQLDVLGEWIGRSRRLLIPIPTAWFSFDDARRGWDAGVWYQPYDSPTGITVLDDETYRTVLRAKIAVNSWDGTLYSARAILAPIFAGSGSLLILEDKLDKSAVYGVAGHWPTPLLVSLLSAGYLSLKPVGIAVDYRITSVDNTPLFGFDAQNEYVSGWDTGSWGITPAMFNS